MNKDDVSIWMPIYIGDILAMTTRLTTEQIGGLYLLMMDYWKNGAIPNDVKIIGAITNLPTSKTKTLINSVTNIGIFSITNDELISAYLDDKKSQATDNKNSKSERGKKAAEARWNKANSENPSDDFAQNKHELSNANAMLEQSASNAQSMLEQCPSSSSSSINNSLSNAHEKISAEQVFEKASQICEQNAQSIQDWQAPSFEEISDMLRLSGFTGQVNQQQYTQAIADFKTHWAEEALKGNPLITDSKRKNRLRDWIKHGKEFKPTYSKPRPQTTQYGGANDPLAVNHKFRPNDTGMVAPNTIFETDEHGNFVARPMNTQQPTVEAW